MELIETQIFLHLSHLSFVLQDSTSLSRILKYHHNQSISLAAVNTNISKQHLPKKIAPSSNHTTIIPLYQPHRRASSRAHPSHKWPPTASRTSRQGHQRAPDRKRATDKLDDHRQLPRLAGTSRLPRTTAHPGLQPQLRLLQGLHCVHCAEWRRSWRAVPGVFPRCF